MKQFLTGFTILYALSACSKQPSDPIGIASFTEAVEVTKRIISEGDEALLWSHSDKSGVPKKKLKEVTQALDGWEGLGDLAQYSINIVEPKDYIPREGVPEEIKNMFSPIIWNISPDKYVVVKRTGENSGVAFTAGLFERDDHWYFAIAYLQERD